MKNQPCSLDIFELVKLHPLFEGVQQDTALSLISHCELRSYNKGEKLLVKDQQREGLLLMLEGISEVFVQNDFSGREEVLEIVQRGELIGFSSLADFLGVTQNSPVLKSEEMVEVRASEPTQALLIPFEVIKSRWDQQSIHDYLLKQVSLRLKDIYSSLAEQVRLARNHGEQDTFLLRVQDIMTQNVIAVGPEMTVQETAIKMSKDRTSSVLVIDDSGLSGIITERDMVERVVAKAVPLTVAAKEIMTPNPVTISRFSYYYDAFSLLLSKGIKHLPVVDDSRVIGIVTLSDLLRKKNESVMKTIKNIEEADEASLSQVKNAIYNVVDTLLKDIVPILKVLEIITKLYDRLVIRSIKLAIQSLESKGFKQIGSYAFYEMGSGGRCEQFMLTDQDHFLVYDTETEEADAYYAMLGREITAYLEVAGYARCKGLMMCSEPQWRGSISSWENRVRKWMLQSTNDHILLAQNFFSYRFIMGDEPLHAEFEAAIKGLLHISEIFLFRLGQVESENQVPTLDQPIRSLFKLERKSIDMKKEVLFPYHHSLQILSLMHGQTSGTPLAKIESLKELGVFSDLFAEDLKKAVSQVLTLYVTQRWEQASNGKEKTSTVHFTHMSTREKEELILSLNTLRELQGKVFIHYAL